MNYIKVDPIKFIFDNPLFFPETSQKYSKLAEQFIEAHNAPPKPVPYNNFHDGKLLPEMAQLLHDMTVNRAKKAADPTTTAAVAKELSDAINHAETPEGRKEICEAFNRDERSYTTDE